MASNWTKPFELRHPLDEFQVEHIDAMFTKLFSVLPLKASRGGTGLSADDLVAGSLLYADVDALNDPILSVLQSVSPGSYLRSGGLLTAPLWSTVKLPDTAAVGDMWIGSTLNNITALAIGASGTIIRSNGTIPANTSFTIPNTFAQGDVLYASAANVVSGLIKDANATRYLSNRGTSNAPLWSQIVLSNGVTGTLLTTNGGTGVAGYAAGDLIFWSSGTAFARIAIGGSGAFLRSNGTSPFWSTLTIPNTAVQGDVFYASATSVMSGLAKNASATRYLSNTGVSNAPAWAQINLADGVTGDLPFANLLPATAISVLVGRGAAAGAGDFQEITLGTGLTMTGTVLSSSGAGGSPGGSDTHVQFNDATAFGGDAGLTYNKTTDILTMGAGVLTLGQLGFPATQNASADANTLDDYEEGTWTPTITGSTSASGQVYGSQVGRYVKIGKFVFVQGFVALSTLGTITGNVRLGGLPFTVENVTNSFSTMLAGQWAGMTTAYVFLTAFTVINTTELEFLGATAATANLTTRLAQADLTATSSFILAAVYRASA